MYFHKDAWSKHTSLFLAFLHILIENYNCNFENIICTIISFLETRILFISYSKEKTLSKNLKHTFKNFKNSTQRSIYFFRYFNNKVLDGDVKIQYARYLSCVVIVIIRNSYNTTVESRLSKLEWTRTTLDDQKFGKEK